MASGTPVGNMIIKVDLDSAGVEKSMTGLQRQLKSSNKSMGAQLSAFDRGEKSADKYGVLIDGLSNRHKIQAGLVDEARSKYDDMTATYGDNSVKAQQAGQELNEQIARYQETGRELGKMQAEFEEFQKLQETQSKTWYKVADGMEKYGGKMQAFGGKMSKTGKSLTKGLTVPIVGIGAALVATAKKTADYADEIINASQKTGVGTDEYQEMSYALKSLGLEQADVDRALGRLNQRMGRAQDGNEKYSKALEAVGISQKDLEKGTYDTDEAFIKIIESLQDVESSQERSAKASEIFGTNMSRKLMPAINGGAKELEALRKEANETGAVMSGKALKEAQEFKFEMDKLKERGASLGRELGVKLIPILTNDLIPAIESKMIPALENGADKIADTVEWFANLDDSTKKNIARFGLFVVAAGPVLSVAGKLTTGVGGLVKSAGSLAKVIGLSRGAGLLGAMGALGPAAIGGVAVAGLVAVGTAVYNAKKDSEELEEVNLDVAQSLSDEAVELDNAAETFDKLSGKAKISNDELAELNDLNKQISESSNPGEVEELQRQYDALAEKSGLSKKELKKLFGANDEIIEQSPDVEKSISDQGNEFAKNTDAVKEYVESLYEMSRQELSDEMVIAEENKREILKDNKQLNEDINGLNEKSKELRELEAMSEDERNEVLKERHKELSQMEADSRLSDEERLAVKEEIDIVEAYINDGIGAGLEAIKEQRDALNEKLDKNDEELAKIEALDEDMDNIILKQAGINEEGEKGLAKLDESIAKNDEELQKLEEKLQKNGELTEKEQERYTELSENNEKQREARDYLHDEVGIYDNLNSLAESKIEKLDEEKQKKIESLAKSSDIKVEEGNIIDQLQSKNSEHDKGIGKLEEQREKEGANKAEIDKQIDSLQGKKAENSENIKKILEELGIWKDLDSSIKDGVNKEIEKGNAVDGTKGKLDSQGNSIDNNNSKTEVGIGKERNRTKEAGKNVNKNVNARDNGTVATINTNAIEPKSKKINLYQNGLAEINRLASKPVMKKINLSTPGTDKINRTLAGYAKGTDNHPGGPAVIGEKGSELVNLPGGRSFLSPNSDTMLNLPKGTQVIPNKETKQLMRSMPRYADGTDGWLDALRNSELAKLLALNNKPSNPKSSSRNKSKSDNGGLNQLLTATLEQNQILMQLLNKDTNLVMNDRVLATEVEPHVSEIQGRKEKINTKFKR